MSSSTATFKKQSLTANDETVFFDPFDISGQTCVFMYAKATGATIDGSVKIQVSANKVDWVDYASSSQAITASGDFYWNFEHLGATHLRVVGISADANDIDFEVWGYAKE